MGNEAKDAKILGKVQGGLYRAYERLGTWRKVAAELGINHGYVLMVMKGKVPSNVDVRAALGFPRVMPSERKARVKRIIPVMGSEGWERVFFKRLRPRRWGKIMKDEG